MIRKYDRRDVLGLINQEYGLRSIDEGMGYRVKREC